MGRLESCYTFHQHHESDAPGTVVVVAVHPKVHPDSPPPMPGEDSHGEGNRDRFHKSISPNSDSQFIECLFQNVFTTALLPNVRQFE